MQPDITFRGGIIAASESLLDELELKEPLICVHQFSSETCCCSILKEKKKTEREEKEFKKTTDVLNSLFALNLSFNLKHLKTLKLLKCFNSFFMDEHRLHRDHKIYQMCKNNH